MGLPTKQHFIRPGARVGVAIGYYGALFLMLTIGLGLLRVFRKRRWL